NFGAVYKTTGASVALFSILAILPAFSQQKAASSTKGHHNASCPKCHSFVKVTSDLTSGNRNLSDNCAECHNLTATRPFDYPLSFHNKAAGKCLDCHQFHQTEMIKAGARTFTLDFDSKAQLFQCLTCHNDSVSLENLSAGHRMATSVYHSDNPALTYLSPSEKCLICHSVRSDVFPDLTDAGLNPPAFDEHGSHPFGIAAKTGGSKVNVEKVSLLDGQIECQSCHKFDNNRDGELTSSEYPVETCRACHPQ
ncbi:MAG: hypothetical protein AB1746_00825, partial [Candidatus Zixiibacteriota bacterium]